MKSLYIKNIDFKVCLSELVGIIGPNGCGKTIILKMICGKFKNDQIFISGENLNKFSIDFKKRNIACVFDDNIYNTYNTKDELLYYLKKLNNNEIESKLKDFISYFDLEKINDIDFSTMSINDRIYIKILSLLIIEPTIFCIDDLLTYLDKGKKVKILNYIKEKNITLLCVTSNMEELLLFDKILVMNKGKNVLFDKTENVLNNEELFKELGLKLPFIYDLNNLLKSYDLIKNNHIIYKECVDVLWK